MNEEILKEWRNALFTEIKLIDQLISEQQTMKKVELKEAKEKEQNAVKDDKVEKVEEVVTHYMREIGIPAHLKGYPYIREAIIQVIKNPEEINSITKTLYPSISRKFETTSSKVERGMRNAIEIAWRRGNQSVQKSIFGYTVSIEKGKPTNSEFVAMIADKVKMEMN